jgi:CheY-like chemotaxis protein
MKSHEPPARVLIADDNEDTCLSLSLLLERAGYQVATAANGKQALDVQRERPSDVLVTDLFMPEMDGLEAIARFRKEFPAVKIVAMSAGGPQRKGGRYLSAANRRC